MLLPYLLQCKSSSQGYCLPERQISIYKLIVFCETHTYLENIIFCYRTPPRKSTLAIMFSTPPKSQIPKTSTPETPKPTHRHPTTSTPESSDNNTSDDSPKISKRELRPPPIKSIIPKLAISSDEDKDKGSGVKGESLISFDLEGISFIL